MADVRLLLREEGRSARNLIAFNVPIGINNDGRIMKKPPCVPRFTSSVSIKRNMKNNARVRSASTGRDKKSELQARYWAFLFENLQRAVDGIYQTCEEDENISECKETILVLENYTRDFHNLIEWFKLKWAYENTPPPLRQAPLAWEVRKTSPCRIWSSSAPPKCCSPLQKHSSTYSNPTDKKTEEHKSIIRDGSDRIIHDALDHKRMKDNRNNVSKEMPRSDCNDRYLNFNGKQIEKFSRKELSSIIDIHSRTGMKNTKFPRITHGNITNTKSTHDGSLSVHNNAHSVDRNNKLVAAPTDSLVDCKFNYNDVTPSENCESINDIGQHNIKTGDTVIELSRTKNTDRVITMKKTKCGTTKMKISKQNLPRPAVPTPIKLQQPSTESSSLPTTPKLIRSKTMLNVRNVTSMNRIRPGSSVIFRKQSQFCMKKETTHSKLTNDICGSVEVLTRHAVKYRRLSDDGDGWQTVRGRYRRGSCHSLNMSMRFNRPTTATSLPALTINSTNENIKKSYITRKVSTRFVPNISDKSNEADIISVDDNETTDVPAYPKTENPIRRGESKKTIKNLSNIDDETNSTSMIAAVFRNEAELLEKKIQQFMAAQAERERIILEEERKTEEADTQRSKQLSDEEEALQRQIEELELTEIDVDTETDETDGEMTVLEMEERVKSEDEVSETISDQLMDDISLEDRYENMLEGMSRAERIDILAQLQALVARHPGRALELHQKLSSPSRKRSLPETLRRYQAKQACAQDKRQKLLSEKSKRLRELLNKVEGVKRAKNQLTEDKRHRMEMKLKRAEENRTQHLLEVVRKAHDEDSKLKEIAFINELEAQNKRHDFMALCQEQEERLQGIHEERQRRQEEKAAKEAAAEVRRRALEAERLLRIQKMRQTRREREERVGKMQLEREKERQELAREKARDREERLSALHAAQLANQEELQKKIAQKQQESARRHGENIEHIRQRAVELSILRMEEVPPTLKMYPVAKQCSLCNVSIVNEVYLVSHLKSKEHLEIVKKMHDGREPSRDELQRFHIAQIRDVHLSLNVGAYTGAVKEKQKVVKRRSRKLKQRMILRGHEWECTRIPISIHNLESTNKTKIRKNLKELDRLCNNHVKTMWSSVAVAGLEKCLGEISRVLNKFAPMDHDIFMTLNGFDTLTNLLNFGMITQNNSHILPNKTLVLVCRVYETAVHDHSNNIEHVLMSNKVMIILELLLQRFEAVVSLDDHAQFLDTTSTTSNCCVAASAIQLLCNIIIDVPFNEPAILSRLHDIIGFLMTGGVFERVVRYNRALIETDFFLEHEHESPLLLSSYDLLYRLGYHMKKINIHNNSNSTNRNELDQTTVESHFIGCLESSEAAGAVDCLYATFPLAHHKCSSSTLGQNNCSQFVKFVAYRALKLLRIIGELDLRTLQNVLGAEGTSLQWRLISSHLIARFHREPFADTVNVIDAIPNTIEILSELFNVLGYFAVNNTKNQMILQTAGAGPSVLQYLCTLPFPFYSDPRFATFTLPTLLAVTHRNSQAIAILSCELSYQLLEEYKDSDIGKRHPLIHLLMEKK